MCHSQARASDMEDDTQSHGVSEGTVLWTI